METPTTTPTTPPVAPIETVPSTDTAGVVETSTPVESEFKEGGELEANGGYKLVYYLTFALLIASATMSIVYHRQAINKLHSGEGDKLKKDIAEVKSNLKRLMGSKYEVITK